MKLVLGIFLALLANAAAQAEEQMRPNPVTGIMERVHIEPYKAPEPFKVKDGMYFQVVDSDWGKLAYQVDTVAQLCFAIWSNISFTGAGGITAGGITNVTCANLANRPEWKPILTWVK